LAPIPRGAIDQLGERPYFFMPKSRRSWTDAMTNGQLVLQCVVQANRVLHDPRNEEAAPAVVVHTTDPARCLDAGFLHAVTEGVLAVKQDPSPRDAELKETQQLLINEHSWFKVPLPPSLTGGVPTTMQVVTLIPQELPGRVLPQDRLIPCI